MAHTKACQGPCGKPTLWEGSKWISICVRYAVMCTIRLKVILTVVSPLEHPLMICQTSGPALFVGLKSPNLKKKNNTSMTRRSVRPGQDSP